MKEQNLSKNAARTQAKPVWRHFLVEKESSEAALLNLKNFLSERLSRNSRLLTYIPLPDELNLLPIIGQFLNHIYAPRIFKDGEMEFRLFMENGNQTGILESGHFGVLGPGKNSPLLKTPLTSSDIIVIPSVAANKSGYRLGRGGGYYDRYKIILKDCFKITILPETLCGIDFKEEAHDIKLDAFITNTSIINFGNRF